MRRRATCVVAGVLVGLLSLGLYAFLWPARFKAKVRAVVRQVHAPTPARSERSGAPVVRASVERRAAVPPNVLLVLIDTLRPDHLGAYGYARRTSPFIDDLAADGVVFENALSQAPWTLPAVLSLMTSRYPCDLGVPSPSEARSQLPPDSVTLAERFRAAGYRTLALSDHRAIDAPAFGRGFEHFESLPRGPFGDWGWIETDERVVLEAWERLIAPADSRPTFAYLHLYYPHAPYEPPAPFDAVFGRGALFMRPGSRAGVINLYDGEILRTDALLARLLPAFWRLRPAPADTVTALVSDHGEAFWEHGRLGHGHSMHNELLRILFALHAPGRVPPGLRLAELAQTVDVGPTLLDVAGLDPVADPGLRGVPLLARGLATSLAPRWVLSESPVQGPQTRAIQTRTIKVIRSGDAAVAYDLLADPGEQQALDLARVPGSAALDSILAATRLASRPAAMHPEQREALEALGYVFQAPR